MVSGANTLAADNLIPVSCEVGPPWIELVHHVPQILERIEVREFCRTSTP